MSQEPIKNPRGKLPQRRSWDILKAQKDIKMTFVLLLILFTVIAIFIFLFAGIQLTLVQALVAMATLVIISFLFTTVAANAIAIVGSNPVSGMT